MTQRWLASDVERDFLLERYREVSGQIEACFDLEVVSAEHCAKIADGIADSLCYAAAADVERDEQRRLARLAASFFAAGMEAHDAEAAFEEVGVEDTSFRVRSGRRSPTAMNWSDGFWLAQIVGADEVLERLCAADSRIPRSDDTRQYDMYHVHFARALRLLWLGESDRAGELLVEAIADADPDREDLIAAIDSVLDLAVRRMGLVAELAVGDVQAFQEKIMEAIDGHHHFFATHRRYSPAGFISLALWGLRAWAQRSLMQVDIDSPYVPEPL